MIKMKDVAKVKTDDLVISVLGYFDSCKNKWYINTKFVNEYINHHDILNHPFLTIIDDYMKFRYSDGVKSIHELFYRLINNIEEKPKCPNCGNTLEFYVAENRYKKYCTKSCVALYNRDKIASNNIDYVNEIKNDPEKWGKYISNKKHAGHQSWANRTEEQRKKASEDMKRKNKETWSNPEERKKRSGNMKKRWDERKANWTEEQRAEYYNKKTKRCKETWDNKSEEELKEYSKKQHDIWVNKSEEQKNEWWNNVVKGKEAKGLEIFPSRKSKQETEAYEYIKSLYPSALRWYDEDKRYDRYECDIYVPEKDAFIECQFFKTHGKHPFNPENENDIKFAESLKTDRFCHNDYKTFTIRDPHKRKIASERNMNFYEMWNTKQNDYEEVTKWLENLPDVTPEQLKEINKNVENFKKRKETLN